MRYGYILVGVASGALGATLGAIITKIVDKKKYDKRVSEINDTMTAVKNRKKAKVLKNEEPAPETGVGASDTSEPAEVNVDEDEKEEPKTEADEFVDHLGPYRPSEDHPYLITEEEFSANDGRNKISVFYYEGDDTAYDISGNEIDVEEDLGMSSGNLDEDRFTDSEEGVVYIRNHRKSEDYVVDLYPGVGGTEK